MYYFVIIVNTIVTLYPYRIRGASQQQCEESQSDKSKNESSNLTKSTRHAKDALHMDKTVISLDRHRRATASSFPCNLLCSHELTCPALEKVQKKTIGMQREYIISSYQISF